jgi:hypothetical protein
MEMDYAQSRFSVEPIITVLRDHDARMRTANPCHQHGITDARFHTSLAGLIPGEFAAKDGALPCNGLGARAECGLYDSGLLLTRPARGRTGTDLTCTC